MENQNESGPYEARKSLFGRWFVYLNGECLPFKGPEDLCKDMAHFLNREHKMRKMKEKEEKSGSNT